MEIEEKVRKINDVSKDGCIYILNKCEESGLIPSDFVTVVVWTAYNAARTFLISSQNNGKEIDKKAIDEQAKKMITESINLL